MRRRDFLHHALAAALAAGVSAPLVACKRPTPPAPPPPPPTSNSQPRVVVLSPAAAVILRDLGHEHFIVGRHASDMVLPASLPVCGDQLAVDLEALLAVRPTRIYTQWGSRDLPAPLVALAAKQGWTLRELDLMTLADVEREIIALDADLAPTGGSGARVLREFQTALRPRPELAAAGRVMLLGAVSPPGALGPGSCHHEILLRLALAPALTTGGPWQELAHEDLLRLDPDVLVLVLPRSARDPAPADELPKTGPAALAALGGLKSLNLRAITKGRVILLDDPLGLTPSTAMGRLAEQLAKGIAQLPQ